MRELCLVFLLLLSSGAAAFDQEELTGSYRFGGQTFYDPPKSEPQDTHLYIMLEGVAAKDLYQKMKVSPLPDHCADVGSLTKIVGQMQCQRTVVSDEYLCWFGVDIKNQRIVPGVVC